VDVWYRVDCDCEHLPALSFCIHDYTITVPLAVAAVVDIVHGEEVGFVALSSEGYLGFFLCDVQVGASGGDGDMEGLFSRVSRVEEGTLDDVEIVVGYGKTRDGFDAVAGSGSLSGIKIL
jgi:hypothetical protein